MMNRSGSGAALKAVGVPQGHVARDLPSSASQWKVKCAGRTLASKASGLLREVWIETYRLSPILEREPGRVRGCLESRPCRLRHV